MVFRGGVVVHHGRVATVGRNGAKALHKEFVGVAAVLVQNFVHGQLGQRFPGGKAALQLDLEPHHGHGVADVGFPDVGKLGVVLHALHQQQRVGAVLHGEGGVLFQHLIHRVVHGGGFGQHGLRFGLGGEEGEHIVVLREGHAVGFQLRLGFRGDAGGVDEQYRAAGRHIAVGHGVGGALDVHGAQVQKPGEVIQLAHELGGAAQLFELAAQLVQLFGRGEARVFLRQDPCRGVRQGGTALSPQLILEVQGLDGSAFFRQRLFQLAHEGGGGSQAAQAQHFALGKGGGAVFLHGGYTRLTHALQFDLCARDLLFRLHEVPAICPQGTLGTGDHKGGVFAVETGEPGQAGVVVGQVFAGVGVAHGDQINGHAVCGHGGAQRSKALRNGIHAHTIASFFVFRKPEKTPGGGVFLCLIVSSKRKDCNARAGRFGMASACALAMFSGKIFLYLWFRNACGRF